MPILEAPRQSWSSLQRRTRTKGLRVAIIDEELPYPPTSGKRLRTWNLIKRLAKRHQLTYLCHRNAEAGEAETAARQFTELGVAVRMVDWSPPPKRGLAFYGRLAANLFSALPYSVASHASSALQEAIVAHWRASDVDLWHCEWTPYAYALRNLIGARRVVMAHNVESLIWQRYAECEANPLKNWYIRQQLGKFQRFERWAFAEADWTVAVSPNDALLARNQYQARRVAVVENGIDRPYFEAVSGARDPNRILFLGSLDWRPNLDGVEQLLRVVFPAVRQQHADARLCLVGRHPPDWLRREVDGQSAIELHGDVADVRPFLGRCGVMVVPLRIGGGSRLKILEALAAGLPVVSTRVGAEGLDVQDERDLLVTEDLTDLATALVRTIRSPAEAQAMAQRGRQRVFDRYDWDALAEKLDRVWRIAAGEPVHVSPAQVPKGYAA